MLDHGRAVERRPRRKRTSDIMRLKRNHSRRILVETAAIALLALTLAGGCQGMGPRRVASAEPGLGGGLDSGTSVAATPAPSVSWVDRHPLFSKPRDMYESTNCNRVVKTAAAAVVGVPVGFFNEIKQIVVGKPGEPGKY